jgi:hypothetical protein
VLAGFAWTVINQPFGFGISLYTIPTASVKKSFSTKTGRIIDCANTKANEWRCKGEADRTAHEYHVTVSDNLFKGCWHAEPV